MASSFDISAAKRRLDEATRARERALHDRYAKAVHDARAIVDMIAATYHPLRIWQWGSLLDERRFREISDIDIAIEGITDAQTFFALYGDALQLSMFSLDIVQMEKIEPEFALAIRNKGKIVYERS